MNAHEMIKTLADAFETRTRTNTKEPYVCLKDDVPERCTEVMRLSHGDMLPDDTRYAMCRHVVAMLTEFSPEDWEDDADAVREGAHEICDGLVDVYTSRLTAWLASHNDRIGYVTQAQEEYGPAGDVEKSLMAGQFAEYSEIYDSIVGTVLRMAEEAESEEA